MSDDLRNRIAAWLSAKRPCRNTTFGCASDKPCPTCRMDADALICDLGLRQEVESYGMPDSTRHRYVTEWETTDE